MTYFIFKFGGVLVVKNMWSHVIEVNHDIFSFFFYFIFFLFFPSLSPFNFGWCVASLCIQFKCSLFVLPSVQSNVSMRFLCNFELTLSFLCVFHAYMVFYLICKHKSRWWAWKNSIVGRWTWTFLYILVI